jgi:[ribosomal protein S5]-alanine N-acetyltransferase
VITTDRLLLRDFRFDDFAAVHRYATDLEVVQYMPWGPNTETDTRDFLDRNIAAAQIEPRVSYGLAVVRAEDGVLVGGIGLDPDRPDGSQASLGYCLAREIWGQGYATEAAKVLMAFGFDVLHLHRIQAACDPHNPGSACVLEKLGMTLEGHLRRDTRIRGEWRDALVYAVLEDD